jgi:hypothetical protein
MKGVKMLEARGRTQEMGNAHNVFVGKPDE